MAAVMTRRRAWKAVRPDGTTRNGFSWEVGPGGTVRSDDDIDPDNTTSCPTRPGDGLCLAKTWSGAADAGFPTSRCLIVEFDEQAVLAEDADKIRVAGQVTVVEVYDAAQLLRDGWGSRATLSGANLSRADLSGANLSGVTLSGANLSWTDLSGADLSRADLSWANLFRADLSRADLSGANLSGADLSWATLFRADLSGADLSGATLSWANLSGATLSVADLSGADLSGAIGLAGTRGNP